ncbi:MAG: zinc ribbon domain-containing protein [Pseudohongiella sp.]|nr:zinc ribbon domain-containing protein [Pseudohongiella sp.]
MPIYEYQCTGCEHKMESLQKISDKPLTKCPVCGKPKLRKLVSAASFRLKGGGWYETDFKTGDKKQLAESDSGVAKTADSAKTTEKTESTDKTKAKAESADSGKDKGKNKAKEPAGKAKAKSKPG